MSLWRRLKNLWKWSALELQEEDYKPEGGKNKAATIVDMTPESPLDKIDLT